MRRNRRSWGWMSLVSVLLLLLAACAGGGGADDSEASADNPNAGEPVDSGTDEETSGDGLADANRSFKIGHPSTIDITMLPSVITNERLNAEGWNVEDVVFARGGLNAQALAQNAVQLGDFAGSDALYTFQAGRVGGGTPKVQAIMNKNGAQFTLVARSDLPTCEDFDGVRFGIHGETSSVSMAAVEYIRNECGAEPEILIIPGGENRIVALENGELDATLVQFTELFELQKASDPGEYVVVDSGGALDFGGSTYWVNTDWYEANQQVATAYVAEILRTCRMIREDPSILADAVLEHTEISEDTVDLAVETYLDPDQVNLCPEDGGGFELMERIIDHNVAMDEIDPMNVEDVFHPTIRQDALEYLESES